MNIAVIGLGVMGEAIVRSLLKASVEGKIVASDKRRERIEGLEDLKELGVTLTTDNRKAVEDADLIILSVKPKDVGDVLEELGEALEDKLLISIAAATPLAFLKKRAPRSRIIRAMPNLAVLVQEAFTAYTPDGDVTGRDLELAKRIFGTMGRAAQVGEEHMDVITGLSGGGPAYILTIIEAFTHAGLRMGLPRDLALLASSQTFLGAAKLALEDPRPLSELKEMVMTPGGVTVEGIYELEMAGLRAAIMGAVEAATLKAKEITGKIYGKEAS